VLALSEGGKIALAAESQARSRAASSREPPRSSSPSTLVQGTQALILLLSDERSGNEYRVARRQVLRGRLLTVRQRTASAPRT